MKRCAAAPAIALAMIASHAAAQAPSDPWRRIPAAATSCFADDGMSGQLHDLRISIEDDHRKQTAVNNDLKAKFEKMDMMEKMQKMQAYMQKNPQEAMKMMQAQQEAATGIRTDVTGADAENARLMTKRDELKASFDKAVKAGAGPVDARLKEYVDSKTVIVGEAGRGFATQAAFDGYAALVSERNVAYEKACAPFFGAGGLYHAWLNDYKAKVAEKNAAAVDALDGIVGQQMVIMQTPAGPAFRLLGPFVSARDYLREAEKVYAFRERKVKPDIPMVRK